MPEGDTVWYTAKRLHAALAGRALTQCELRWPSLATVDLRGRRVTEVVSVGKHILIRIGPRKLHENIAAVGNPLLPNENVDPAELTLHSHLRMDGSWRTYPRQASQPGQRSRSPSLRKHTIRAILGNDEWLAIGDSLGMLDLVATTAESNLVGHLGPDVLGANWNAAAVAETITHQPDRAIGEVLLDQRVLAGVGTFYMSEVLFLRKLTPWTPVRDAGDITAVLELTHRLLFTNRDKPIRHITGIPIRGKENWVHCRSGRPCLRCGNTVRVAMLGQQPTARTAFYCPTCQTGPTPTDDGAPQAPLGSHDHRPRYRS